MLVTKRGDGDACEACDNGGWVVEISNGEGVGRPVGKCIASGEEGVIDEDLPRPACCFRSDAGDMGLELFVRPLRTGPADRGVVTFKPFTRSAVGLRFATGR